jgi:hypothetical protein
MVMIELQAAERQLNSQQERNWVETTAQPRALRKLELLLSGVNWKEEDKKTSKLRRSQK